MANYKTTLRRLQRSRVALLVATSNYEGSLEGESTRREEKLEEQLNKAVFAYIRALIDHKEGDNGKV